MNFAAPALVPERLGLPTSREDSQTPIEQLAQAVASLGERRVLGYPGGAVLEIFDSPASPDAPDSPATVVWLSEMGQALHGAVNAGNLYRLAAVRQMFPDHRFVVLGMPDGSEAATHFTDQAQRERAARSDFSAFHEPLCRYLEDSGAGELYIGGCSGGAEIGADLVAYIASFVSDGSDTKLRPTTFVGVEAPGVRERTLIGLGVRFLLTATGVKPYVRFADPAYRLALHLQTPLLPYIGSMFYADNRAIAHGFSRAQFVKRIDEAMAKLADLRCTVAWGAATEFTPSRYVVDAMRELKVRFGDRLEAIDLGDHRHAICRDPCSVAAIALRGFSQPQSA